MFDGSLEEILENPESLYLASSYDKGGKLPRDRNVCWLMRREALDKAVDGLHAMDPANVTTPEDAHLSDYVKGRRIFCDP